MSPVTAYFLALGVVLSLLACRAGLRLSWSSSSCVTLVLLGSTLVVFTLFNSPTP